MDNCANYGNSIDRGIECLQLYQIYAIFSGPIYLSAG